MSGEEVEEVMGGDVRVALPTRMLDGCASLGDVLSKRTWLEVLDADDRASLRAHLPRGFAEDEIPALLERLFHPAASDAGYFHAGNPAERVWREMRARERHPDVVKHKAAIATVDRGIHDHEVRLHHNRVARAALRAKRVFDKTPNDMPVADRAKTWRERGDREDSPEPELARDATPTRPPAASADPGPGRGSSPSPSGRGAFADEETVALRASRDAAKAAEIAAREAMAVATEQSEVARRIVATSGDAADAAMRALRAAEDAMAAAEAARRFADDANAKVEAREEAKRRRIEKARYKPVKVEGPDGKKYNAEEDF